MTFELRTARLVIRDWRDDDLAPFAAIVADPVVMEHFPALLSREESDAMVARLRAKIAERGFGFWAVEAPLETSLIGFVGLSIPGFAVPFRHEEPCVEIGWRLARAAWGKGYATEAARAALRYGFDVLGREEIVAFAATANTRSRRVMEKLGMVHDPGADFDHPKIADGPLRRHVLYRARR